MRALLASIAFCSLAFSTPAQACSDCGLSWNASQSAYGQQAKQPRYARQQVRQTRVAARYAPLIAQTPLAIPAQIVNAVASTGVAIVDAMAPDLGKNLRGQYGGAPYCGFYLGTIVQRMGFKPPPQHGWAPNWAMFGAPASGPAPGVIMVTRTHVGIVKAVLPNGMIVLRGGNQGRSLVRDIVVSPRGAIAWRVPA